MVLAANFNETVSLQERSGAGGSEMARRCRDYSKWINNNGILDLGCSGPKHTWFRGKSQDTFKSARLDRGVANGDWRLRFKEGAMKNLPSASSGHRPVIVSTMGFSPISIAL